MRRPRPVACRACHAPTVDTEAALAQAGYDGASLIGQGGQGRVYRALDGRLQRPVAIKVLRSEETQGAERLLAEARMLAAAGSHPNILPIYAAGALPNGSVYVVTPLAEAALDEAERLPISRVLDIGVRLASALVALHALGISHGDITPRNILFLYGQPMLADFGLASRNQQRMRHGFTPAFAPPESIEDWRPSGPPGDVYSLARTLLAVLEATPMPPSETYLSEAGEASRQPRVSNLPSRFDARSDVQSILSRVGLPSPLLTTFRAALDDDPLRRPNAQQFRGALQDAQRAMGLPVTEAPTGVPKADTAPPVSTSLGRDEREIYAQSVFATATRVRAAAMQVEERRGRRFGLDVAGGVLAGVATSVAIAFESVFQGGDVRAVILVSLLILAAVTPTVLARLIVYAARRRETSLISQSLELSARARNAYLKELEATRLVLTTRAAPASDAGDWI